MSKSPSENTSALEVEDGLSSKNPLNNRSLLRSGLAAAVIAALSSCAHNQDAIMANQPCKPKATEVEFPDTQTEFKQLLKGLSEIAKEASQNKGLSPRQIAKAFGLVRRIRFLDPVITIEKKQQLKESLRAINNVLSVSLMRSAFKDVNNPSDTEFQGLEEVGMRVEEIRLRVRRMEMGQNRDKKSR